MIKIIKHQKQIESNYECNYGCIWYREGLIGASNAELIVFIFPDFAQNEEKENEKYEQRWPAD